MCNLKDNFKTDKGKRNRLQGCAKRRIKVIFYISFCIFTDCKRHSQEATETMKKLNEALLGGIHFWKVLVGLTVDGLFILEYLSSNSFTYI